MLSKVVPLASLTQQAFLPELGDHQQNQQNRQLHNLQLIGSLNQLTGLNQRQFQHEFGLSVTLRHQCNGLQRLSKRWAAQAAPADLVPPRL